MELSLAVVLPIIFFYILDLIIIYDLARSKVKSNIQKIFFYFAIGVALQQGLSVITYSNDYGLINLNACVSYIFDSTSILCETIVAYFWFRYLLLTIRNRRNEKKFFQFLFLVPVIVMVVCLILTPFTHIVYYIDENGIYSPGKLFFLQILCPYSYPVFSVVFAVLQISKGNRRHIAKIVRNFIFFVIPTVIGAVIQVNILRGGYSQIGISFTLILMYIEQYIEDVQEIKRRQSQKEISELNFTLNKRKNIIQSMSKIYFASYYIDITDDSFIQINEAAFISQQIDVYSKAQEALNFMCENMVHPEYTEKLKDFVNISTLDERMAEKLFITCDYVGNVAGWCQMYLIEGERDNDGKLRSVFLSARTIHDEKIREEENNRELKEARDAAEVANNAKTVFLNNMSHDIRTPMNAILGFTELMEKEKTNPEVISNYIKKIKSSGEYLLSIINNILDMARIESGNATIDETFMDLISSENTVLAAFEDLVKKKNQTLNVTHNLQHRYVLLDAAKSQEITMNLLSNAVKYTPDGGMIKMHMEELPCDKPGYGIYRLIVSDNGIGMSSEFVEHIFEYFSRERNTTESQIIGTGLGMSIVKKLVDLMGGTIEVESEVGKGSKFTITFVHKIVEDPGDYLEEKFTENLNFTSLDGKRVLLAEDNELNAEIAFTILMDIGLEVERAADGVECVDMLVKAKANYYDLILMDIQMPNLNGYDATKKIRTLNDKNKSEIPIIAMTANAFEEDKKKALDAGMNAHLAKPINIEQLIKTLNKVLAKA